MMPLVYVVFFPSVRIVIVGRDVRQLTIAIAINACC